MLLLWKQIDFTSADFTSGEAQRCSRTLTEMLTYITAFALVGGSLSHQSVDQLPFYSQVPAVSSSDEGSGNIQP